MRNCVCMCVHVCVCVLSCSVCHCSRTTAIAIATKQAFVRMPHCCVLHLSPPLLVCLHPIPPESQEDASAAADESANPNPEAESSGAVIVPVDLEGYNADEDEDGDRDEDDNATIEYTEEDLIDATHEGNWEKVAECIEYRRSLVEGVDEDGRTALCIAFELGHEKIVHSLVSGGSNLLHHADDGMTPLHYAARDGHIKLVKYILYRRGQAIDR